MINIKSIQEKVENNKKYEDERKNSFNENFITLIPEIFSHVNDEIEQETPDKICLGYGYCILIGSRLHSDTLLSSYMEYINRHHLEILRQYCKLFSNSNLKITSYYTDRLDHRIYIEVKYYPNRVPCWLEKAAFYFCKGITYL